MCACGWYAGKCRRVELTFAYSSFRIEDSPAPADWGSSAISYSAVISAMLKMGLDNCGQDGVTGGALA